MKKKVIIGLVILVLLIGCLFFMFFQKKEEKPKNDEIVEEKEEVKKEEPKIKIIDLNSKTRPIAVMINNHSQARPNHSGLQDAYIIYEAMVEGGITRMMALYKDANTEKIGSVRSSRPYYLDYVLENDAIYVHFGYSDQAKSDIQTLGINNINGLYDESAFWRDRTLNVDYEHTAFTSMEKINDLAKKKGYRTTTDEKPLINYSVNPIDLSTKEGALVANKVSIPYSYYMNVSYTYDAEKQYYLRYTNEVAHTDAITKEQYHFKNIIVVNIENYSLDAYGRQALNNIGTGNGYYITNGYAIPITYQKSSRSSKTIYKYLDGTEIDVNDGNTFIQIQPINQVTSFE